MWWPCFIVCVCVCVCVGAISLGSGFFNSPSLTASVTHVECTGEERTLRECELTGITDDYPCEHHAGVICRGKCIHSAHL